MTIRVRPADLSADRPIILEVLSRNLPAFDHHARFSWLYEKNPCGMGWAWVACDTSLDKVVGIASVFPRAVRFGKETLLCGQVGDFAVDQAYRTLGPALMLQRATFGPVNERQMAFCYDCPPHEQGMATFHRLGMKAQCQMVRYARLLRCDQQIEKIVGARLARLGVTSLLNAVLAIGRRMGPRASGVEFGVYAGPFCDEFTALDLQDVDEQMIRGRRTAEDLNWRYVDDPLRSYRTVTARRSGELIAYAVACVIGSDGYLVDLRHGGCTKLTVDLLHVLEEVVASDSAQTFQCLVSDTHRLHHTGGMAGWWYRSKAPRVVAYAAIGTDVSRQLESQLYWDFMHGDVLA